MYEKMVECKGDLGRIWDRRRGMSSSLANFSDGEVEQNRIYFDFYD